MKPSDYSDDMSSEEFLRIGKELIEYVERYLSGASKLPVLSRSKPGAIKQQLPVSPPQRPESMEDILKDVDRIIVPGLTHWNNPGFMAYFGITSSKPAILGELLSATYNVNGMLWKTSPAATELEEVVLDWLRQSLGLPVSFEGVIHDTASTSSLIAIAAAREALGINVREEGLAGRDEINPLVIYTSEQSHSSIEKGAIVLGIGQANVRKIPVQKDFQMRVDVLEEEIKKDLSAGRRPFCVVATVGTTSTTSIDPVQAIARLCKEYRLWLHIDAAYGGIAGIVPEYRHVLAGCENADSIVVNPHKWLFVPIDCSVLYCQKPDVLKQTFSLVPEYLRTNEDDVMNYMDYGIALGRRFRALKLWMVFRFFGLEGIIQHIRRHITLAQELKSWIEEDEDFELMAPVPFSVVCFRYRPRSFANGSPEAEAILEKLNESLFNAVNASGEIFVSHTKLDNRFVIRLAIGNIKTTHQHLARAWELIRQSALECVSTA